MPTKEQIIETALTQLIAAGLQEKGMNKAEAQVMSKAAMIGLKQVDKGIGVLDDEADRLTGIAVKKIKRKLNPWQKYVKANSKQFKFKSGAKKGQVDFKKMSRAFKKTPAGRKKK